MFGYNPNLRELTPIKPETKDPPDLRSAVIGGIQVKEGKIAQNSLLSSREEAAVLRQMLPSDSQAQERKFFFDNLKTIFTDATMKLRGSGIFPKS